MIYFMQTHKGNTCLSYLLIIRRITTHFKTDIDEDSQISQQSPKQIKALQCPLMQRVNYAFSLHMASI